MKKIATFVILVVGLSITPAEAANLKLIHKEGSFKISKFCDGRNLIYLSDPNGWRGSNPTIFVSPNDSQCRAVENWKYKK